jgi:hypothetical protein
MKKSDLRSGMVVVTRKGTIGIVLLGTTNGNIIGGCGKGNGSWKPFDSITDDLCETAGFRQYDIVKVYNALANRWFGSVDLTQLDLIWERDEEPVELTIEQIAEKFGIDPGLVRIKKD